MHQLSMCVTMGVLLILVLMVKKRGTCFFIVGIYCDRNEFQHKLE